MWELIIGAVIMMLGVLVGASIAMTKNKRD